MRNIIVILICMMIFTGCAFSEEEKERALDNRIDNEIYKAELYENAYKDGYMDAVEATIEDMPWMMVDFYELEDALYEIFDDDEFAEEIRDLIVSECELYQREDFLIDYSDSGMDFDY